MTNRKSEVAKLFKYINHKIKIIMRKNYVANGITMPQGMVIGTLFKHGEMKISDLSSELGMTNSTISGIIDRLEKQEMVERIRSQVDKRVVFVKLTPKVSELYQCFGKTAEAGFLKLLDNATSEEIEKVIEGLTILKRILDQSNE